MKKDKSLSSAPGITYNVTKCKGGYGVYLCALSGQALANLCGLFPGMRLDVDENSETYAQVLLNDEPINAVRVNSNRIARAPSHAEGLKIINRLKAQSEKQQLERIFKLRVWLVQRDKVLVKGKYFQVYRDILGKSVKIGTTQQHGKAQKLVNEFLADGTKAELKPSVTRTKVLHPHETGEYWDELNKRFVEPVTAGMVTTPYTASGITGMCSPKQGIDAASRIMAKRKRTTKVSFYAKYR